MTNIVLTEDQAQALQRLRGFESGFFLLEGGAGTGKTTLIQEYARSITGGAWGYGEVAFTAPTNKAVRVLEESAANAGMHVDCMTIYALLGLVLMPTGNVRPIQHIGAVTVDYGTVVIDECSMIGDVLWGHINAQAHRFGKIIFMGDVHQLPPVNEEKSKAFSVPDRVSIKTIVRQQDGHPIVKLGADIRAFLDGGAAYSIGKHPTSIHHMAPNKFKREMVEAFKHSAGDPSYVKVMAWRNSTVDEYNAHIRNAIYGRTVTPFVVGETATPRAPIVQEDEDERGFVLPGKKRIHTDATVRVNEIWPAKHPVYRGINVWVMDVTDISTGVNMTVYFPADDGFADEADRRKQEAKKIRQLWPAYYSFVESFADLAHTYACTVHRAQGSTYTHAFVDVMDINLMRGPIRDQCLYVACSRPRKNLVVNGDVC